MADMLNSAHSIDLVRPKKLGSNSCPLPDDVLTEILSYLPAKTFFRLLSVCKTFRKLSSDSRFLLSQSYHNNAISGFFDQCYGTNISLLLVDPYADVPKSNIEFMFKREAIILGSAGGLVVILHTEDDRLCVYNPARGTRCRLPSPTGKCFFGGIAVSFLNDGDGVTKDYKLVYLSVPREWSWLSHCRVYDSVARAWTMDKELDFGPEALDFVHPVVCDETVFWVTKLGLYVVAFDMKTDSTQIIELPEEASINYTDKIGIGKWEGKSLCLIHYCRLSWMFSLWKLRKTSDGAPPRWAKLHEISMASIGSRSVGQVSSMFLSEVATATLLVFTIWDDVYGYSMKDGKLKKLASLGCHYPPLIPYSNTLRPCGRREELLKQPNETLPFSLSSMHYRRETKIA